MTKTAGGRMTSESKRSQLIQAAFEVFSEKGYNAASVKNVADRAGITPGLVHYYFASKEDLLIAVQRAAQSRYHELYNERPTPESPAAVLEEIRQRVLDNPDWYRWRYELYALGLKGGLLQQEAAAVLQEGRESVSAQLRRLLPDPDGAEHLAAVLLACFDGLALQHLLDGNFNLDAAYQALAGLLQQHLAEAAR